GLTLALLLLFGSPTAVRAQEPKGSVSFINQVAPILMESCFACHDAKKRKGKLDMTTFETLQTGGTKGDLWTAGAPEQSVLIDMLTAKGTTGMPPKDAGGPLPKEKIDIISRWIKEGAKLDAGIAEKAALLRELRVRWQHRRPPLPTSSPPTSTPWS